MTDLRWPVIVALGMSGLLRPVLSVAGVFESRGPWAPLLVTGSLAVLWVAVAVGLRVNRPVLTLTLAGVVYGLSAIVLNLVLHLFLDSAEWIPAPGYVAILVFNAALGAVLGSVALGLLRRRAASLR